MEKLLFNSEISKAFGDYWLDPEYFISLAVVRSSTPL